MSMAVEYEADRLWIINVGDLKPYEMSIEFIMNYGYDASRWNYTNLDTFTTLWAQREFDLDEDTASTVSEIIANVTRINARRKLELLNSTTYSLSNYRE
jgi:hypothetical protein